jgi:putative membrane protein insertion efficiency factor
MSVLNKALMYLVRAYQLILSPYFGGQCRFVPSCSDYACECLSKKGSMKSIVKITWRVLRCNPWSAGGYDPVDSEQTEQKIIEDKLKNGY